MGHLYFSLGSGLCPSRARRSSTLSMASSNLSLRSGGNGSERTAFRALAKYSLRGELAFI